MLEEVDMDVEVPVLEDDDMDVEVPMLEDDSMDVELPVLEELKLPKLLEVPDSFLEILDDEDPNAV